MKLKQIQPTIAKADMAYRKHNQLAIAKAAKVLARDRFYPQDFETVRLIAHIPGLDPAFDNYTIVHLTDLHVGHWLSPQRLSGVINLVNQHQPDTIVITGDFVSYVIDELADDLTQLLSQLKPKDHTLAVLGNHDHWLDPHKVRHILHQSNVQELENTITTTHRGCAKLHFAGVDDITINKHNLQPILEQLPPNQPTILLAHEPDFADEVAKTNRFHLQLSGHSHGGQLVFPIIGPIFKGKGSKKYPLGSYQVGNMALYTNRGLGTHTFRLRLNCKPEITHITLKSTNNKSTSLQPN